MNPSGSGEFRSDAKRPLSAAGATAVREVFGYPVISRLGVGARSIVYLVTDPNDKKKKYAVKRVMRNEPELDDPAIEQVKVEYDVGHRLDHKNLRKIHELLVAKKLMFFGVKEIGLLMELAEGSALLEKNDYDLITLMEIFLETADGLGAMHKAGFAHADMKPHNIMVGSTGAVKLVDFGQSCPLGTMKTRVQGTPEFIAPEQVYKGVIDSRTDVYNLGATMYWAFTGKHIPSPLETFKNAQSGIIPPAGNNRYPAPMELNPKVPSALSALIMQCCRSDRKERPADMAAVRSRLEPIVQECLAAEVKPVPPETKGIHVDLGLEDSMLGDLTTGA